MKVAQFQVAQAQLRQGPVHQQQQQPAASSSIPRTQHNIITPSALDKVTRPISASEYVYRQMVKPGNRYAMPAPVAQESLSQLSLKASIKSAHKPQQPTPNVPSPSRETSAPQSEIRRQQIQTLQAVTRQRQQQQSYLNYQKFIQQQQQQYQQTRNHTRRATLSDVQTTTIAIPSSATSNSPPLASPSAATSPFVVTHFAGVTRVPPTFLQDRNTYYLDGTREHPKEFVPSTPLDDLIDEILVPFPDVIDTNVYHPVDGTRIHPPEIPDSVRFAKEFAEWDEVHRKRPQGPRLSPFANRFVPLSHVVARGAPVGVQSATTSNTFAALERAAWENAEMDRKRAGSDVGRSANGNMFLRQQGNAGRIYPSPVNSRGGGNYGASINLEAFRARY